MAWHSVFSLLDDTKLLFRYDPERRLIEIMHKKGKAEVIDLQHFHVPRGGRQRRRRSQR